MAMLLKKSALTLTASAVLYMSACQPPPPHKAQTGPGDPETPAGKAGKIAYKVEKETEKAAKEAGAKIDQAARDARAGYDNAEKKSDK
jgi:hypothetical protein